MKEMNKCLRDQYKTGPPMALCAMLSFILLVFCVTYWLHNPDAYKFDAEEKGLGHSKFDCWANGDRYFQNWILTASNENGLQTAYCDSSDKGFQTGMWTDNTYVNVTKCFEIWFLCGVIFGLVELISTVLWVIGERCKSK